MLRGFVKTPVEKHLLSEKKYLNINLMERFSENSDMDKFPPMLCRHTEIPTRDSSNINEQQ